jgi:hypothetical protein
MSAEDMEHTLLQRHTIVADSPRFTGGSLSPNTKTNYEKQISKFWYFLAIVGDYESMLMLLAQELSFTPSINSKNIKSFCDHRFLLSRQSLLNPGTTQPLLDIEREAILAEGTTKNYKWLSFTPYK